MCARIRDFDWAKTPLGPRETWSPAPRMMVPFLLANRFPLLLWWGPHYVSIYNDAYRPVLGDKHPRALGQPASECWREIWDVLEPLIDTPFRGGPATWDDDICLGLNRHGFVEETHFTIAYSPVPGETVPGGIGGVLATVHEITGKVVGDRRVETLRDLGARSVEAKTAEEACALAAEVLEAHPGDIPFALLYLIDPDRKTARLAGAAGLDDRYEAGPATLFLDADRAEEEPWPLAEAMRDEALVFVTDLSSRLDSPPPPDRGPIRHTRPPSFRSVPTRPIISRAFWSRASAPGFRSTNSYRGLPPSRLLPDRRQHRQRPGLRGGAEARRGAGGDRPGEDRLLLQRQPRVPHAVDAHARAARGAARWRRGGPSASRPRPPRGRAPQRPAAVAAGQLAARLLADRGRARRGGLPADRPRRLHRGPRERRSVRRCERAGLRLHGRLPRRSRARLCRPGDVGEGRPQPPLQRLQVHLRGRDLRRLCERGTGPPNSVSATPASA